MEPIYTAGTQGVYGAPVGDELGVEGLPYRREVVATGVTGIYSVWEPSPEERESIAAGGNIVLGIIGMEPIPPVSIGVGIGPEYQRVAPPANEPI